MKCELCHHSLGRWFCLMSERLAQRARFLFLRRYVRFVLEVVGLVADEALLDWMVCVCAQAARQSVCMLFVCKDRWCVISVCRGVAPHTGSTKPTLFTAKSQHPIIRRDPPLPRSNKLKSLICYECSSFPSPFHLMCFYFLSVRWLVGQDLAWFPCNLSVPERMVAGRRCAYGKWPSGVGRRLGIEFWLRDELGNILMAC